VTRTVTTARCHACDWTAEGAAADKASEKHTKATGHPTAVVTVPGGAA